jgi:tetratricopeptide (TPR) repeat protein
MRAILSILLSVALSSPLAIAQPKPKDPKTREEAAKLFNQGEAHFKLGDYDKALESYKQSYVLTQEPLLLFNIGQCYRNMKQYEKALESYELLLREAPNTSQRSLVESQIEEVKKEMAKAPDKTPDKTPNKTPATQPDKTPDESKSSGLSPKVFFSASVATGGVGLVFSALAISQALAASRSQKDPEGDPADIQFHFDRANTLGHVADGFFVAAVVTGGIGLVKRKQLKKQQAQLTVSPTGVALSFQF